MPKTVLKSFWPILAISMLFLWHPFASAQEPATPESIDDIDETQYIGGEKDCQEKGSQEEGGEKDCQEKGEEKVETQDLAVFNNAGWDSFLTGVFCSP